MARQPKEIKIAGSFVHPDSQTGWVRTGDTTAVPTKLRAMLYLDEPPVEVHLLVVVGAAGKADIREIGLVQRDRSNALSTSLLRRIPLDHLLRVVLDKATITVKPRTDISAGAFQLPGEPDHQAWVSPPAAGAGRGRQVPADRVSRAANVYRDAVAAGSRSPAEDVAAALHYSRATAARDIRAARERGLLAEPGVQDNVTPPSNEAVAADPIWRRFDDPTKWASMSDVITGPSGLPVFDPSKTGTSAPSPTPVARDISEPDHWLQTIQDAAAFHRENPDLNTPHPENESSTSDDAGAADESDQ